MAPKVGAATQEVSEPRAEPLGFQRAACRQAPAWALGCQAPPEVTLSEPVEPEINHSHPSKGRPVPPLWPEPSGPPLAVCIYLSPTRKWRRMGRASEKHRLGVCI